MKLCFVVVMVGSLISSANAKDIALILNDKDVELLKSVLDMATKAHGLSIAPVTIYLSDKINKAPVVTEQKDDTQKEPQK